MSPDFPELVQALSVLVPSNTSGAFIESEEAAIDEEVLSGWNDIDHLDIARDLAEQALLDRNLDLYSRAKYEALLIVLPGGDLCYHFENALDAMEMIQDEEEFEPDDPHPSHTKMVAQMQAVLDMCKRTLKALSAPGEADAAAKPTPETGDTSGVLDKAWRPDRRLSISTLSLF